MPLHYFALRIEPHTLVAAEVSDHTAACMLDRGEPVLLGTFAELGNLAQRLRLPLVTMSRTSGPATSTRNAARIPVAAVA